MAMTPEQIAGVTEMIRASLEQHATQVLEPLFNRMGAAIETIASGGLGTGTGMGSMRLTEPHEQAR